MAILSRFDRDQLHGFIAVAIELADTLDGDPDLEDGDEDGQCTEDEISTLDMVRCFPGGPGCEISDPDAAADDIGCDDNELDLDEGYFDNDGLIPGGGSGSC